MAAKDGDPTSGCSLTIKKDGNQETSFKLAPSQCAVGNMAAPYDVFISHCGQDCKRDFAVLLRRELQELAGVRCFFDERDLHPGDNAAKEMLAAMQSARIGIVILSQGFFAREWCIKELHTFVELGNLLPVFLGIGPDQLGECADANTAGWAGFCKFGIAAEDIQRVVKAAGAFTGVRLEALDGFWDKCIAQVKSAVLRQLGRLEGGPSLSAGVFLVGIDKHLTKLKRLLGVSFSLEASMDESPESVGERAALIGIKGMGGVGKTTLAKSLFDDPQVREAFGGKVCWVEVNQNPSQEQVCRMQEQILETLCDLGDLRVQVHNPSLGQADIRRRLGESKVLVFLDNVWYDLGRSQVASPDWFGPGSCVVITTRSSETIGPGGNVYELDPLDPEEALTLFSWHAFLKMGAPSSALASLARRAAPLCGGLPVVIEVVGARAATETSCKEESDTIAWWESALLVDSKLEKKVTDRLRPSYDDLQKDEKQAFVLVAGLWHGVLENFDEQAIVGKLAAALYEDERDSVARAGKRLNQLIQKSLVKRATRVQNGEEIDTVTVHDSLVELGVIIAEEERECGRWVEKRRAPNLQKDGLHWQHLVIDAADGLKVPASLFSSNEGAGCALKSVVLRGVQLPALSPGLVDCALLSLIDLKPNSETGQTANLSGLTRLQSLDLIGCKSLVALEGLSELAALQSLDLSKSSSLTALEGLSCLSFLQRLDVSWCKSLTTLEGLNWLTCLTSFEVRGCLSLNELRGLNGLTGLRSLDLSHCRSLTVVEGLSGLVNLHRLDVTRCGTLTELQGLSGLQSLRSLVVRGCSLLKTLKGLDGLIGLHSLEVKGCQCLQRIEGLSGLTGLQTLLVKGCKSLETLESFDELASLKWAEVSECETLKTLEGLGGLTGLQTLTVTHCRALTAPEGLSGLAGLQELTLKGCPSVKRLEKLDGLSSLRNLTVNGCGSLTLLEGLGALANLQKSDVIECGALTALDGFGGLVGMKSFQLSYCRSVTALESLHALSSLEDLCVSQCKALTTLRGLQGLSSLRTLQVIYCRALTELDGLGELTSLRVLDLTGCEAIAAPLKGLDDLLARSTSLQAAGCVALLASNGRQELPVSFG